MFLKVIFGSVHCGVRQIFWCMMSLMPLLANTPEINQPPRISSLWVKTLAKERTIVCDFSPDSTKVAVLNTESGILNILSTHSGENLWTQSDRNFDGQISQAVFNVDGTKVVIVDNSNLNLYVLNSANGERLAQAKIPSQLFRPTRALRNEKDVVYFMGPVGNLDVYLVELKDLKCSQIVDSNKLFPTLKQEMLDDIRVNVRNRELFVVGDHILLTIDSFVFDVSTSQKDSLRCIIKTDSPGNRIITSLKKEELCLMRGDNASLQTISLNDKSIIKQCDLYFPRAAIFGEFAIREKSIVAIETESEGSPTELIFGNLETGITETRIKVSDDHFLRFESKLSPSGKYLIRASESGEVTCYEIDW